MIEHLSLGTRHYAKSIAFFERALAPLGYRLMRDTGAEAAFGVGDAWSFFLYPVENDPVVAQGMHVAFAAATREQVKAVHAAALGFDVRDIFAPKLRPDVSATYFGAMFEDFDGHRLEVLTNSPD